MNQPTSTSPQLEAFRELAFPSDGIIDATGKLRAALQCTSDFGRVSVTVEYDEGHFVITHQGSRAEYPTLIGTIRAIADIASRNECKADGLRLGVIANTLETLFPISATPDLSIQPFQPHRALTLSPTTTHSPSHPAWVPDDWDGLTMPFGLA